MIGGVIIVILYTIECPDCIKLQNMLNDKNITYSKFSDIDSMRKMGFTSYPILEVDGKLMNYSGAIEWIREI